MSAAAAWELSVGGGVRVATALTEVRAVVTQPRLTEIPATPHYCSHAIFWQGMILPVLDLAQRLDRNEMEDEDRVGVEPYSHAAIVVWQPRATPASLDFGCLLLTQPPRQVEVSDAQQCDPPDARPIWRRLTLSHYKDDLGVVSVLDIEALFQRVSG